VPPLVEQHLGWLKPTASKKMYNAELVERRSPGVRLEPSGYPTDPEQIAENTRTLLPLVESATREGEFRQGGGGGRGSFAAFYREVAHADLLAMLQKLHWRPDDHFAPDLAWLAGLDEEQIGDWVVMLPQHVAQGATSMLAGRSLSLFRRRRRRGTLFGAISDPKHRAASARIAGTEEFDDPQAASLYRERRGSLLLYPVTELLSPTPVPSELDPAEVIVALSFVAPMSTGSPDKTLVRFKVRDVDQEDEPIIDA
jgi:hypothetical protein